MRLGSCIALEVATGVLTLSATAWGVVFAAGALRGGEPAPRVATAPAADDAAGAALPPPLTPPGPDRGSGEPGAGSAAVAVAVGSAGSAAEVPAAALDAGVALDGGAAVDAASGLALEPVWTFLGQSDQELLAPLREGRIKLVKFNGGGTSLSLRLEFEGGAKAAFKPDQIHRHSVPRKEVAAYRIDRLLALGRVPPAIARTFSYQEVSSRIASGHRPFAHRLQEEAVPHGNQLRGELSWWIPELGTHVIDGRYRIDSGDGVDRWKPWAKIGAAIPPGEVEMLGQLSSVTVFDFLIDNLDRWSGGNANTTKDGTTLYFMDNTMAFSTDEKGHPKSHRALQRFQVFSRGLVDRLRKLDEASLRAALEGDPGPYEALLTDGELRAVLARTRVLLAYVDELIARHGEDKVLVFP